MRSASIALLAAGFAGSLLAQGSGVVTVDPPQRLVAKRGTVAESKLHVRLQNGYHVNSNTPSEDYLIPLRLTWSGGPLQVEEVVFPKPVMGKYSFSPKPISVFTGDFDILTRFRVPEKAPGGPAVLAGKLRYQACNHNSCLPPKTIELRMTVSVQ